METLLTQAFVSSQNFKYLEICSFKTCYCSRPSGIDGIRTGQFPDADPPRMANHYAHRHFSLLSGPDCLYPRRKCNRTQPGRYLRKSSACVCAIASRDFPRRIFQGPPRRRALFGHWRHLLVGELWYVPMEVMNSARDNPTRHVRS